MAMFWWGPSPKTEVRLHKTFYPACQGKCRPLLTWMLQELDVEPEQRPESTQQLHVVYHDNDIVIVDKPAGMLSVPGRDDSPSVKQMLEQMFPEMTGPVIVHRLDMDTSGLMVAACDDEAYHNLQRQFAEHIIKKRYIAVTTLADIPDRGMVRLPLRADEADRPRQIVDRGHGRDAINTYRVMRRDPEHGEMTLELTPHTGRPHQLRVHCAHRDGLAAPIKGDRLYGISKAPRMYLHAAYLEITHLTTGHRMRSNSEPEWE